MNRDVAAATEHDRMLGNVLMIGVIAALDAPNALVQVSVNGLTTDWIPWITRRAGPNSTWSAPEVGEQVVVGCPYGDPSQGFVMGSLYQQAHHAPATTADKERVTFSDGTSIEYDRATHAMKVDLTSAGGLTIICKTATVQAQDSITFDAPSAHFTGNVQVDKTLTAATDVIGGGKSLKSHTHGGVQSGGSQTSPPT
jgi:phage baseplate assembly protein V